MKKDKKNINEKINLILLKRIGKTTTPKKKLLGINEIKKFLNSYYV
jgi:3-dehydroquinate synthetase